jgi:ribonuclease HI
MDTKYYAVYRGKQPGIYATWLETREQTDGYPGAVFCRCNTLQDAESFLRTGQVRSPFKKINMAEYEIASPRSLTDAMHSAGAQPLPPVVKKCFDIKRINPADIVTCRPGITASQLDAAEAIEHYRKHPDYKTLPASVLYVYTDGSTYGNGTRHARGGYGIFYSREDMPPVCAPICQAKVTNCVAELTAILETLKSIQKCVLTSCYIYSDCEYAMDVISGRKNAHTNLNLVEPAQALFKSFMGKVKFVHVRSHTGAGDLHSLGNVVADILAKKGTA